MSKSRPSAFVALDGVAGDLSLTAERLAESPQHMEIVRERIAAVIKDLLRDGHYSHEIFAGIACALLDFSSDLLQLSVRFNRFDLVADRLREMIKQIVRSYDEDVTMLRQMIGRAERDLSSGRRSKSRLN